jgi:hypothetical protein
MVNNFLVNSSGLFKLVFTCTTYRTYPVFRKLRERGSWSYVGVRVSLFRVIDVSANFADVAVHVNHSLPSIILILSIIHLGNELMSYKIANFYKAGYNEKNHSVLANQWIESELSC